MKYLLCILGFIGGMALVVYREKVKRFTGDIASFEKYFGQGGTYTGILIVGFVIAIGSILFMTGTIQGVFGKFLGPLFGI